MSQWNGCFRDHRTGLNIRILTYRAFRQAIYGHLVVLCIFCGPSHILLVRNRTGSMFKKGDKLVRWQTNQVTLYTVSQLMNLHRYCYTAQSQAEVYVVCLGMPSKLTFQLCQSIGNSYSQCIIAPRKPPTLNVAIIQLARGHRLLPGPVAWPSLLSND